MDNEADIHAGHYLVAFGIIALLATPVWWWLANDYDQYRVVSSMAPAVIFGAAGAFLVLLGVILIAGRRRPTG